MSGAPETNLPKETPNDGGIIVKVAGCDKIVDYSRAGGPGRLTISVRTTVFGPPLVVDDYCFGYADLTRSGRIIRRTIKFSILSSDRVFEITGRTRILETFSNDNSCIGLLLVLKCFTILAMMQLLYCCANLENRLKAVKCSLQNVLVRYWIFINKKKKKQLRSI